MASFNEDIGGLLSLVGSFMFLAFLVLQRGAGCISWRAVEC